MITGQRMNQSVRLFSEVVLWVHPTAAHIVQLWTWGKRCLTLIFAMKNNSNSFSLLLPNKCLAHLWGRRGHPSVSVIVLEKGIYADSFFKKMFFCILSLICKGTKPCDWKHRPNLRPQVPLKESVCKIKIEILGGDSPLAFVSMHTHALPHMNINT